MNSNLHQYPAVLYSAVSETGYRDERFTGEVVRSERIRRSGHGSRFSWRRLAHLGRVSRTTGQVRRAHAR